MHNFSLVVIFALLLPLLASAASNVLVLTPENFDSNVVGSSKAHFVEFYAPWCGHCKNLEPEYEKVGEAFAGSTEVAIAKVDADAHKELGSRFDVHGFPTLKFFPKGWKQGDEIMPYEGARTTEALVEFVKQNSGAKPKKLKVASSAVVDLTPKNFDAVVKDPTKDVLVEFYAPWCGHCKRLVPDYEKVANIFKNEKDVVIAKMDADNAANKDIAAKYGVSGFPTLKWFPKANKAGEEYASGRDVASFVAFVNDKAGTHRTAEGTLDTAAGRLAPLDALAASFAAGDQAALLKEAVKEAAKVAADQPADAAYAKLYVKFMEKIQAEGKAFITSELARLTRLIESPSTAPTKVDEFTIKKNILSMFQ